jgi:NAD(P)-dependent dehydrogenase (short-subunit alcohol dehydrogenase family)
MFRRLAPARRLEARLAGWDIKDKVVLVTGGTSGIGLECAVELAKKGAKVTIVGREQARADAAVAQILQRSGQSVGTLLCDFSSLQSIREAAAKFRASHDALHVLVNNAGLVTDKRLVSKDGFEMTFAVNHLGYFLFTHELLDLLLRSAPARIVNTSSKGHFDGTLDFADLQYEKGWGILKAYSRSKLCNVLWSNELARRLEGRQVSVNALHPGVVATNIWGKAPWFAQPVLNLGKKLFMVTPAQGAKTLVLLASSPDVEGQTGLYWDDGKVYRPARLARDAALAKRLWEVSERLTGLAK